MRMRSTTIQDFYAGNPVPITSSIIWQYANTKALSGLINQKSNWYNTWVEQFWISWVQNIFNLITANEFGLAVWSIILDYPLFVNTAIPDNSELWGFNSGTYPDLENTYMNFDNGNFAQTGESINLTDEEQRFLLRLRYLYCVSRGSIPQTNYNLNWLMADSVTKGAFAAGEPISNPTVLTGSTLIGSNIITGLSSTMGLFVGEGVVSTDFAEFTTVTSILSSTSIQVSTNALSTNASSTLNFGNPTAWVLEDFNMQITYQFNFYLPLPVQLAFNAANCLPDDTGVNIIKQYWNGTQYVSFQECHK